MGVPSTLCLILFVFAGVLIGAVGLILIGAGISATPLSLAGPATRVGTILVVPDPCCPIMAN